MASGSGSGVEAGDVLRHRAGEKLHVLRLVADMRAERLRLPLIERCPVKPHAAAERLPDADEKPQRATTFPTRSAR